MPITFILSGIILIFLIFNISSAKCGAYYVKVVAFLFLFNLGFFYGFVEIFDTSLNVLHLFLILYLILANIRILKFSMLTICCIALLVYYLCLNFFDFGYPAFNSYIFYFLSFTSSLVYFSIKEKLLVSLVVSFSLTILNVVYELRSLTFSTVTFIDCFSVGLVVLLCFYIFNFKGGLRYEKKFVNPNCISCL